MQFSYDRCSLFFRKMRLLKQGFDSARAPLLFLSFLSLQNLHSFLQLLLKLEDQALRNLRHPHIIRVLDARASIGVCDDLTPPCASWGTK